MKNTQEWSKGISFDCETGEFPDIEDFIIAIQKDAIKDLEEEVMEQCRINARGQERELILMAENEKLKRQLQIKQYQVDIADESYSIVINERINERLKK